MLIQMLSHLILAALKALDLLEDTRRQRILPLHVLLVARDTSLSLLFDLAILLLELLVVAGLDFFQLFHEFFAHAFVTLEHHLGLAFQVEHLLLQPNVLFLKLLCLLQSCRHFFEALMLASGTVLDLLSQSSNFILRISQLTLQQTNCQLLLLIGVALTRHNHLLLTQEVFDLQVELVNFFDVIIVECAHFFEHLHGDELTVAFDRGIFHTRLHHFLQLVKSNLLLSQLAFETKHGGCLLLFSYSVLSTQLIQHTVKFVLLFCYLEAMLPRIFFKLSAEAMVSFCLELLNLKLS